MSIKVSGTTYGCAASLEKRGYLIRHAGQMLSELLKGGGSLPSTYTLAGTVFDVVKADITPNGSSDNQTALNSAYSANRAGTPTLVVLPPNEINYRYSNVLTISANTYVVGYGATVEPLGIQDYAHSMGGDNAGIFGVRMLGNYQTYSKWPERAEDNPAAEPNKSGSVEGAVGGSTTQDAWVTTTGRTNIIVMDNIAYGSLTGFVRCWGGASEHLYEGNVCRRMHSDTIHLTYNSSYMTARKNRIFDGGDDCISVVSYDKTAGPAPRNILVEKNEIRGSRARGLTVVGGLDVMHQDNTVEYTFLAPFLYASTATHNTHDVRAVCRRNIIYRGGQRTSAFTHNEIAVVAFSYTGATVNATVTDNECNTYGEYYASGADFTRKGNSSGTVNFTESGNAVRAIKSSA